MSQTATYVLEFTIPPSLAETGSFRVPFSFGAPPFSSGEWELICSWETGKFGITWKDVNREIEELVDTLVKHATRTREEVLKESVAEYMMSPLPNDVEFIFPQTSGEAILNTESSQLAPLPFEESDDEDDGRPFKRRNLDFPHSLIKITDHSYKTYHSVVFWIYTGDITFTPSPPPATRSRPLPASPKAIYRLAHILDLPKLQSIALSAIILNLTPAAVVNELFSETSGTYDDVLDALIKYAAAHRAEIKETEEWRKVLLSYEELPWGGKVMGRLAGAFI
ncbi:hypothetical protein RQP46_002312 [Phenoliferia psychrophenolica]